VTTLAEWEAVKEGISDKKKEENLVDEEEEN